MIYLSLLEKVQVQKREKGSIDLQALTEDVSMRFVQYCSIETGSNPQAAKTSLPSTPRQKTLADLLVSEAAEIGYSTDHFAGGIIIRVPANMDGVEPILMGAHLDTSPDVPTNREIVNVRVHEKYDGLDIRLENGVIISPKQFPHLRDYRGDTIFTSDGTTLLGGDDKAGVAALMTFLRYLQVNPKVRHGEIDVVFTYDEELGLIGATKLTPRRDTKAKYGFIFDGSQGKLGTSTFNAESAYLPIQEVDLGKTISGNRVHISITGNYVHPGHAKAQGMIDPMRALPGVIAALRDTSAVTSISGGAIGIELEAIVTCPLVEESLEFLEDNPVKRRGDNEPKISFKLIGKHATARGYDPTTVTRLIAGIPYAMSPEQTEGFEGYIFPFSFINRDGELRLRTLIRDFTQDGMDAKRALVKSLAPEASVEHEYSNMANVLAEHPYVVDIARKAMTDAGFPAISDSTRGGNEASTYTLMKPPISCANVSAEGEGCHSVREWQGLRDLVKAVQTAININTRVVERAYRYVP